MNKRTIPFQQKKLAYSLFLGLAILINGCTNQKAASYTPLSANQDNFVIDGDVANHQNFKNANIQGLQYDVQSNAQYLYISVKVTSKVIQDQILRYGMGVHVDTTGKQKNYMGISFPLALNEEMEAQLTKMSQTTTLEKAYVNIANEFEMIGFAPEPLKATNLSSQHFKAALGFDEVNNIICEYQIPWKAIYQNRALNATEKLMIRLQVNDKAIIDSDKEAGIGSNNALGTSITQGQNMNQQGVRSPYGNPMGGMRQGPIMHSAKTPNYTTLLRYEFNFGE